MELITEAMLGISHRGIGMLFFYSFQNFGGSANHPDPSLMTPLDHVLQKTGKMKIEPLFNDNIFQEY